MATKYRKRPIEVEALQWTGDNYVEMLNFTDPPLPGTKEAQLFALVAVENREDNPEHDAEVFDKLHSTWVSLKPTDWVICGVQGEFYPCTNEVFEATYEAVE